MDYLFIIYGLSIIALIITLIAQGFVSSSYSKYSKVNAIAFDPYTHGYYKVTERVGEAFKDGLKLK